MKRVLSKPDCCGDIHQRGHWLVQNQPVPPLVDITTTTDDNFMLELHEYNNIQDRSPEGLMRFLSVFSQMNLKYMGSAAQIMQIWNLAEWKLAKLCKTVEA